jgi:hypothetical protein
VRAAKRVTTAILAGLLIGTVMSVAACDDAVEPGADRFALVSINGEPLPGPYPDPQGCCSDLEVIAGELVLEADGTLQHMLQIRCRTGLPAGTTCEVTGDGKQTAEGSYSRSGGTLTLGEGPSRPATFEAERVVVTISLPPSAGFYPTFILEYRRS